MPGRSAKQMVITVAERSQSEITPEQAATLYRRVGWLSPCFVKRSYAATTRAASDRYDELALAVEDDAALNGAWLPLRVPEELYTVATLAEFSAHGWAC